VRFAEEAAAMQQQHAAAAATNGMLPSSADDAAAAGEAPGSAFAADAATAAPLPDRGAVLSSATASAQPPALSRRRLMYSKSGLLVSPADFAAAWSKRYWFSAALSLTAFGCMMAMLGTGKDAATFGYAPF
jgi:hypothetical protein